jgi:hypothetical protein
MKKKCSNSIAQTVINYLYRYPIGILKKSIKYGGPLKKIAVNKGKKQMKNAALNLKFTASDVNAVKVGVPICFLTGKNHWYLTAFCIYSLMKQTKGYSFKFKIFDDGSLDHHTQTYFIKNIPQVEIIQKEQIKNNLEIKIPNYKFPEIIKLRSNYVHIKKITDIHSAGIGTILLFDSDMLFFKKPSRMIEWAINPVGNFFIRDRKQSYGIDTQLMGEIACTTRIPEQFNAGLYGIDTNKTNFDLLEKWIIDTKNPNGLGNYYWEQALTAMLIAQDDYQEAPAEDYIVKPTKLQVENQSGILHHYVEVSQNLYYTKAWKNIV